MEDRVDIVAACVDCGICACCMCMVDGPNGGVWGGIINREVSVGSGW